MSSDQRSDRRDVPTDDRDVEDLRARIDVLREENRRLRAEHRRALQTRYRRTALGLGALGLVALGGTLAFPDARDVLLALAGVGLFAGLLVYYLTPERFVAASVGDRVYQAYAATGTDLVADLGLADRRVYVPTGSDARLFVPQHEAYRIPDDDALDGVVVATDDDRRRGVALHPTGGGLYREFERTVAGEPADEPGLLAEQLADAVVEGFELADGATADAEPGRVTVGVTDPVYGDVGSFDHPIASFVGAGVATALDRAVEVEVAGGDDDRVDALVTATWTVTDAGE